MESDIKLTSIERELLEWFVTAADGMVHIQWGARSMYLPECVFTIDREVVAEAVDTYADYDDLSSIPLVDMAREHEGGIEYYERLMRLSARGFVGLVSSDNRAIDLPTSTFSHLASMNFQFRDLHSYKLSQQGLNYVYVHLPLFSHLMETDEDGDEDDDVDDLPF